MLSDSFYKEYNVYSFLTIAAQAVFTLDHNLFCIRCVILFCEKGLSSKHFRYR